MRRKSVVRKSKLNARQKSALRSLDYLPLSFDFMRRLRNALIAMASMDPRWMIWLENKLPKEMRRIDAYHLHLVETRAKSLLVNKYSSIFTDGMRSAIIASDKLFFNDTGNLVEG